MAYRIAINGFGRIGRAAFRVIAERKGIEVVAINDLTDAETLATLLKYDSVYGRAPFEVSGGDGVIVVDKKSYPILSEKDAAALPWKDLRVDVVLECTGRFTVDDAAQAHIAAGARRVVISAPTKGGETKTYIMGVNADGYQGEAMLSNASCTTNCVGPVTAIIDELFGIEKAALTTVHSYTAEQNLVDGPPPALHKDLRRARAAAINIVPTSTGAAVATTKILPSLTGKFDGMAIRVPTPIGSLSDFTFITKKTVTIDEVNAAFRAAATSPRYLGILSVTDDPIVSTDIIGDAHSAIVDLSLTNVIDGNMVKVIAWYDNEWGYANRLVDMASLAAKSL